MDTLATIRANARTIGLDTAATPAVSNATALIYVNQTGRWVFNAVPPRRIQYTGGSNGLQFNTGVTGAVSSITTLRRLVSLHRELSSITSNGPQIDILPVDRFFQQVALGYAGSTDSPQACMIERRNSGAWQVQIDPAPQTTTWLSCWAEIEWAELAGDSDVTSLSSEGDALLTVLVAYQIARDSGRDAQLLQSVMAMAPDQKAALAWLGRDDEPRDRPNAPGRFGG